MAKNKGKEKAREISVEEKEKKPMDGEMIMFAPGQFPEYAVAILTSKAEMLGAKVTTNWDNATIIILNPSHRDHQRELSTIAKKSNTQHPLSPMPYHWILCCALESRRLDLADLPTSKPFFTHLDGSKDHAPLRVWVSVNIHRALELDAHEAQAAVMTMLQRGGALIVEKRGQADVLVVDRHSQFFVQVIMAEIEKNGRTWQKLVERDWVEDCVKNGRMVWPRMKNDDGHDSMAEDEPLKEGKGPGRPTGKPRVDYSPQDDDFLCRYLAAHHPNGAWKSSKTYQTLASMSSLYPIARRHSNQSWQERFKKNQTTFEKRIKRCIYGGVDDTLKTAEEREKTRVEAEERQREAMGSEAEVAAAEESEVMLGLEATVEEPPQEPLQTEQTEAGPSRQSIGHNTVAEREGARLTEMAPEAMEAGTNDLTADTVSKVIVTEMSAATQAMAVDSKTLVELDSDNEPDTDMVGESSDSLLPYLPIETMTVERGLEGGVGHEESPESGLSNGHVPEHHGVETQAILSEIAMSRIEARGSPSKGKTVRMDVEDVPRVPRVQSRSQRRGRVSEPEPTIRHARRPSRDSKQSDMGSLGSPNRQAGNGSPSTRLSLPLRLEVDVRGVSVDGPPRFSAVLDEPPRFATPQGSPSVKRSRLQDEIVSSASKRRRALERAAFRGRHPDQGIELDTVYVSADITPPRPHFPSPDTSNRHNPRQDRPAEPPLSRQERNDKILAGQRLVLDVKEQYKERIQKYSERYGVRPTELFRLVNEMPKGKGGSRGSGVYWEDVEQGLKEYFGR